MSKRLLAMQLRHYTDLRAQQAPPDRRPKTRDWIPVATTPDRRRKQMGVPLPGLDYYDHR